MSRCRYVGHARHPLLKTTRQAEGCEADKGRGCATPPARGDNGTTSWPRGARVGGTCWPRGPSDETEEVNDECQTKLSNEAKLGMATSPTLTGDVPLTIPLPLSLSLWSTPAPTPLLPNILPPPPPSAMSPTSSSSSRPPPARSSCPALLAAPAHAGRVGVDGCHDAHLGARVGHEYRRVDVLCEGAGRAVRHTRRGIARKVSGFSTSHAASPALRTVRDAGTGRQNGRSLLSSPSPRSFVPFASHRLDPRPRWRQLRAIAAADTKPRIRA